MEIFNRFENVCFVEALSCMKNIKKTFTQTGFADLIYLLSPVPKDTKNTLSPVIENQHKRQLFFKLQMKREV